MDPLTHTLVGGALARTALGRSTRLAGAALLIGANLPDLDVLAYFSGSDAALGFRRGWTHGPLALLALPPLLTGLLLAYDSWARRRGRDLPPVRASRLLGLAFLASATHPLLDWLNTYGVRLLMPFDPSWYYGDALFIVDPWLWLILGAAVFLAGGGVASAGWCSLGAAMGLVLVLGGEHVPPIARVLWFVGLGSIALLSRWSRLRRRPARAGAVGLALALVYVLAMLALASAGSWWVGGELQRRGISEVERLMVGPLPANPLRWTVVAQTPLEYRVGQLRWQPRPRLELDPLPIERPRPSPVIDAATAAPQVRGALTWMRFPFVEVEATADGTRVHWLDARYLRRRSSRGFGSAVVELDRQLRVRIGE